MQTLAGARGRPPHPLELIALTSSGREEPRNLVPADKRNEGVFSLGFEKL